MRPDGNGTGIALSSAYLIGGQLCMRGIGLISTVILVRLLSPQDFGIAALATTIYVILDTLTATGFNMALIRMSDPTREHYDTAWTLGIIRGVIIALALVATAGLQSRLMHEPRIAPVMWVIGAQAAVMSFANIRLVDYERNMRFHILAWWMISGRLLLLVIGLTMLIFMRNYWVLILASFASRAIALPAGYIIAPYRPRFSLAAWRDLFHFSKWLFLGNLCVVSDSQLMNFVVGHFLGLSQVGFIRSATRSPLCPSANSQLRSGGRSTLACPVSKTRLPQSPRVPQRHGSAGCDRLPAHIGCRPDRARNRASIPRRKMGSANLGAPGHHSISALQRGRRIRSCTAFVRDRHALCADLLHHDRAVYC